MYQSGTGLYKDNPENRLQDIELHKFVLCALSAVNRKIRGSIKVFCKKCPVLLGQVTRKTLGSLNAGQDTEIDVCWFYAENGNPSGKFVPLISAEGVHQTTNGLVLRNVLNIRPNVNTMRGDQGFVFKLQQGSIRTLMDKGFSCMNKWALSINGRHLTIVEKGTGKKASGNQKSSTPSTSAPQPPKKASRKRKIDAVQANKSQKSTRRSLRLMR